MQISIHTSAREVTAPVPFLHWKKLISIHTSAREVTWLAKESPCSPSISIHTSAREVTVHSRYYRHYPVISIHTSAREVTNTWLNGRYRTAISIHTSAREVTSYSPLYGSIILISIHTSAREVTAPTAPVFFNSCISIHTSAREVTMRSHHRPLRKHHFNPHFRKGSDFIMQTQILKKRFQSTLPQGKWLKSGWMPQTSTSISIHTSAREVTDPIGYSPRSDRISIHTSAREVTGFGWFGFAERDRFQSTLPQGKWPGIP